MGAEVRNFNYGSLLLGVAVALISQRIQAKEKH